MQNRSIHKITGLSISQRLFMSFVALGTLNFFFWGAAYCVYEKTNIEKELKLRSSYEIQNAVNYFEKNYVTRIQSDLDFIDKSNLLNTFLKSTEEEDITVKPLVEQMFSHFLNRSKEMYLSARFIDATGTEQIIISGKKRLKYYATLGPLKGDSMYAHLYILFSKLKSANLGTVLVEGPFKYNDKYTFLIGVSKSDPEIDGFAGAIVFHCDLGDYINYLGQIVFYQEHVARLIIPDNKQILTAEQLLPSLEKHKWHKFYSISRLIYMGSDNQPFLKVDFDVSSQVLYTEIEKVFQYFAFWILLSILSLGLIAMYMSNFLSKPLRDLVDYVDRLALGDFSLKARINVTGEIGVLVDRFNYMGQELQKITVSRDDLTQEIRKTQRAEERLIKLNEELNQEKLLLRKREEDFHLILDSTAEAIYGIDLNGNCMFCNPSCLRMLGYNNVQDLLGKNMHALIHHTYPDGTPFPIEQCQLYQAFKNNLKIHVEELFWRSDGTSFFADVWSYPEVRNTKTVGAVVSFLDITERKNAEEVLLKREAYLTSILDNFPFMVWLKDTFGRFLAVNQVYAKAHGRSVSEIIGKTDFDFVSHETAEKYQADDIKVLIGRQKVIVEEPIINGDAVGYFETFKSPIFDNEGLVIGSVGFARDITERKKAEEALRDSEERYRKITSSITDYIYHVQIDNGKPVSTTYSPGCLRVTGYRSDDFISNPFLWFDIIAVEDRPLVERQIQDVLSGKKIGPLEHRIKHKDGHICWVKNTIVCQFDNNGKMIGYDGLISNITERKKVEGELNEAKERAEQALAIKDEFTSTVSHELRTPLAAIKSSIDILDTGVPGELTADQKIFIKRVKSNIDRLARLINDVLDLSKLEAGKMVMNLLPLRAESVVQEVVDTQDPLVKGKGLTIKTEFGENLPTLVADKDRLIQVLNNLINNALKFTKEGGIVVAVHSEDKQSMTFSVRDTGVGIKDEDLTKLFQKFQQVGGASQQVAGTGLGLAISKLIVSKHKGRIWVESQYGKGSSFNFIIPIRKEKRILIVDDDEATLEILKNILEKEEIYEIEMASDGFRAGQKYYDFSPQLIILDINLPKMNGLEVCAKIKNDAKTKHTKIIILSSFNSDQKRKEAWDAGADEILNKPINLEELIAKIRKLI